MPNLKKTLLFLLIAIIPLLLTANDDRPPIKYDFLSKKQTQHFVNTMVTKYHFKRSYMNKMMNDARLDRDTLNR